MINFTTRTISGFSKNILMGNRTFTFKSKVLCFLFAAVAFSALPVASFAQATQQPLSKVQIKEVVKETSNTISFIENKGQWNPDVKVAGNTNIGNMYIVDDHIHFLSFEKKGKHEGEETAEDEAKESLELGNQEVHGWGIYLDGSNKNYTITKEKEMPTKYNYLIGDTYHGTNASSYGELTLNDIYQGVDLRIYSQQEHVMEFDWLVNPGADFRNIKMRFKGQDGLSIDEKGNLNVKLEFDVVKFDIPEAYQIINGKKVAVKMAFEIKGDVATFKAIGKVDSRYALVIDPSLKWGTWFDNNSDSFDEYLFAVDIDNAGNMYCGGNINVQLTSGAGNYINPASLFGFSNTYAGSVDGIVYELKFDGSAVLAITYFGSTADDRLYGLNLSPDKSTVYICGKTAGTIPSGSTTAFDNSRNSTDGFVAVLNSSLSTVQYSSYIGDAGTADEMVTVRAISNNSFVLGGTVNGALTSAYISNAYDATYSGNTEMYIAKFTGFNTLTFGTYIGGTSTEQLNDIQIFSDGAIAFSGSSGGTGSFPALFNNAANGVANTTGGLDGVIGVLNASGGSTVQMLSRFGGTSDDEFYGLTIDAFDTLYVTGFTSSTNFYLGPNATAGNRFQITKGTGQDAFFGKISRNGWNAGSTDPWAATYFGGSGDDRGNTLRSYTPYAMMIFGESQSDRYPFNKNISDGGAFFDSTANGGWDIFYQVLGTDLKTQYFATLVGGGNNDYLGQTGTPHGSNHFVVEGDSLICLGTTVHSRTLTPNPVSASGVFDPTSGPDTDNDDLHLIFKWRIGILLNFDQSDAPASYGRPNHVIFQSLKLGTATIDREDFPLPSYKCDSDDRAGSTPDDEDAIAGNPTQVLVQDTSTRFSQTVNVTNNTGVTAMLMGWIDFNEDGDFNDANEVDTAIVPAGATSATLIWRNYNSVFQSAAKDTTYMRLRLTTQPSFFVSNPSPTASAANGEVEDYLVIRFHCVNLAAATIDTNGTTACGTATGSIVITNGNLLPGVQYGVYYSRNGGALQGPFYYTTSGGVGTLTITGLLAGTYTAVEVFHPTNRACGYTLPGSYTIVDPNLPPAPTAATATPNPVCTGTTVQFNATTNQSGTITWSWTGPQSFTSSLQNPTRSITATNLAGTYQVTQTINSCTSLPASVNLVVNVTPAIVSVSSTNPTTCSGTQGTITLTGLTANATYVVNYTKNGVPQGPVTIVANGAGNVIITGLNAGGPYSGFTVAINGCTSAVNNTNITLTDPSTPPAPTSATATPSTICTGNTVQFNATTNQSGTITWSWTGPQSFTSSIINPTRLITATNMAGTYQVTQTINNCTSPPASVVLTVNPTPTFTFSSSTNPTTCAGSSGTIVLAGLNNNTTYSVSYSKNGIGQPSANFTTNGSGSLTITGLTAGAYTNIVVTLTGCPSAPLGGTITLSDPTSPAAPTVSSNSPVCTGNAINLFTTLVSGATYSWTGPSGFTSALQNPVRNTATTAFAGDYCLTITVAGCTSPASCTNVVVNTTPSITSTSSTNPTTCTGTNGTITLNGLVANASYSVSYTLGGTPQGPFTISANGSGSVVISNLAAGSYAAFTVTLAGCTSAPFAGPVVLTDPSTPATPVATSNSPVCSGNTLTLGTATVSGATYSWTGVSGNGSFTSNAQNPTRTAATTAMSGSYCVVVTVANCPSAPGCVTATVNPTPVVTSSGFTNPTSCAGNDGTIFLNGLTANTTYSVRYNKNGIPAGPFNFTSNGAGTVTIPNLTQGNYTLIVVTLNGCQSSPIAGPLNIQDPTPPAAPAVSSNSPVCSGGAINLFANGNSGASYNWTGPVSFTSTQQNPVRSSATTAMSGDYCVTQTVASCVSDAACVTVTVNQTPAISSSTSTNPTTCSGTNGTIVLNGLVANTVYTVNYLKNLVAQGPFSISTNASGVLTVTGLTAGSYTSVTVALTGCTSAAVGPFTLTDPSNPSAPNVSSNSPVCSGNTINLSATGAGGATYSWTGPLSYSSTSQNPAITGATTAMSGSYCATQTVANCTSNAACTSVVVNQTPTFTIFGSSNPTSCGGSQGNITLSGLNASANYSVTYTKTPGGGQGPFVISSNASGQLVIGTLGAGSYSNFVVTLVSTSCASAPVAGPVVLTDPTTPAAPTVSSNTPVCSGNAINLTANGQSGATYSWTGPNSYTSSSASPSIPNATTAMSGSYCATQTVAGCTSSAACTSVVVNQTPAAPSASASPNPICSGNTLTLTATGTSGATYNWTFPDGGTATGSPVTRLNVTTAMAGTYSVTQTVNGCTSTTSGTVNVVVNQTPAAPTAGASPNPICSGNTLTLTASGISGATFSWSYPDGGGATGSPLTRSNVTTAMGGLYSVTQTVNGCTSTTAGTVSVTVNQTPAAPSASASPNPICSGNTLTLTATGTSGATYNWTFPDGGTATGSPVTRNNVTTGMSGIYSVTQTVNGCTSTTAGTVNVTVNPTPAAPTAGASPNPICSGNTLTLTASGVSGATFAWTYPDGGGASGSPVTRNAVTTAMSGVYSVTQTVSGCTSTTAGTVNVLVNQTPAAPTASASPNPICSGNTLTLTATGLAGATFTWNYPDGGGTTGNPVTRSAVTTAMGGTYSVTQTVNGCTSTTAGTVNVIVNQTPAAPSAAASPNPICSGNTLTLSATGVSGATFNWTYPDAVTATGSPVTRANVTTSMSGTYSVTQTVSGCTSTTAGTVNVTVNPTPASPSASNNGPVCLGALIQLNTPTVAGATYVWSGPNGFSSTTQNPTVASASLNSAGVYSVTITVSGCSSTSPGTTTVVVNNCAPIAVRDVYSNCAGTTITGNILTNDLDPSGNGIQISLPHVCGPFSGSISVNSGGAFTYTPPVSFNGVDSICYKVCNANFPTICDTGIAVFDFTCVNLPPVAVDDNYNTNEDTPVSGNVTTNDYDPDGGILTVNTTPTCNPQHGAVTLAANGAFTYTPVANYNGLDTFCYSVCDNGSPVKCATATVVITVIPVNDPPVVPDSTVTTPEDTPFTVCLPVSDVEVTTQSHSVNICGSPVHGTLTAGPTVNNPLVPRTLCLTYSPAANFNGADSMCFIVCDNGSPAKCDTTHVYVNVTPVNDPPIAVNDNYTTTEDATINATTGTGVRVNDNDNADGNPVGTLAVSTTPVVNTTNGTLTINDTTGAFTYVPNANFSGTDSFQYRVCDNGTPRPPKCDTATAYITITPVNDPPVVVDTPITQCEDCGPITVCIPVTDVDAGQQHYVASTYCGPNSGTSSYTLNGPSFDVLCVTYTPSANFNGRDSICLVVCDNGVPNLCDTTRIPITVTPVNDPPIAVNDNYSTNEDVTIVQGTAGGVRTNDNDNADGNPVTSLAVTTTPVVNTTHGTLTITDSTGAFTYVPNANFSGTDSFQYRVCDNGTPRPPKCDTATAYITINPVNDPPVVVDTPITQCEDCGPITVCIPVTDVDAGQTHYVASTYCGPNSGTSSTTLNGPSYDVLCVTYTPNTNFNGTDSICIVVCDNGVPNLCDTTRIPITVTPVNDPPIAVNDNYSTTEDVTITATTGTGVRVNDNDNADGNPVGSLAVTTTPVVNTTHGTLTITDSTGAFTYVPNANFSGTDSFQYRVCDNGTPRPPKCDTATAYITISPVNDPPVVVDTPITQCEDCGPITVCIPVTDADAGQVHYVASTYCGPNSGIASYTLNGPSYDVLCVTYTPNTNFNGRDSICLIVCDNGSPNLCDTTRIPITVTPVNDPPIAVNDNYSTTEDVTITATTGTGVRINDNDNADGNPVGSLAVNTTPVVNVTHGTLTINDTTGAFTYVPNANFSGTDSFQYRVCDNGTPRPPKCDTATAYITITPVNDPPIVPDTTVTTPEDSTITVCLTIADADGTDQHVASFCDAPDNGVITSGPIVSNGSNTVCITYRPNANFNGRDSICLTICDNGIPSLCDNTTIRIIVTPVNDPPVAVNDNYTTTEDVTIVQGTAGGVRTNDNDNADGNPVTSLAVSTTPVVNTTHGTLTINDSTGAFTYVPVPNFFGTDSFQYRVCDNGTPRPPLCDTATAYITITQVNDPPVIIDTPITTCEDCPITVCIPFSDADVTDIHNQSLLCNPVNGTVANITISDVTHTLCFTYQGYTNINGTDSMCIVVCDNGNPVLCDTTHITIILTPVNDPPYADTIYVVTHENQPVGVNVASATGDLEGDPLSYTYGGVVPNSGTYYITGNGAIVFVPNTGFTGTVTIPYSVCDLSPYQVFSLCDSAAIIVTVLPAGDTLNNHAPVANNDYATTPLNRAVVINELANDYDPDGDALQVTITGLPVHGTVTVNPNGTVNYTPNTGYFGFDTIHYVICDPVGTTQPRPLCDDAFIIISISRDPESVPNDAPVAVDDFKTICADAVTTIQVLTNDYDPNGNALNSVTVIRNVTNGTLANPSLGLFTYDPNNNFAGQDTFEYRVCDNGSPSLCDTARVIITVNPTPVITPSVTSLTTCSNDNVDITFTSSVPGAVISWTATNGTSGTGDIHTTLANTGTTNQVITYTVTGSTPSGCGSPVVSIPVTVRPRPVVSYTINNTVYCSGNQVVINLSSTIAGTIFSWSGSNGSSGTGNIITDNPVNNGTTNITVTYTINSSYNGCSGTPVTVPVTVKPNPVLTVTPPSQTVCSGTPITVAIASNVPGTSVIWSGSNGNSGNTLTINDSPINTGASNLTVTYTVNGSFSGCSATTVFATVVVRPKVNADAGADKTVTSCSASCVTIGGSPSASGGNGTFTYAWSPSVSVNDTSLANPTVCNLGASQVYILTVTDGNNCSATDAVAVTVTPSSLTAEAGSGGALCLGSGDSVMLGGFPTAVGGTPPYNYTWAPTAGLNLTNPANPEAFPSSTTTYYLTLTDALGCISIDSATVRVYPTLVANAGADTTVCATYPAQLGGTPTATGGSGVYSYIWSPSQGISDINAANPTATPIVLTTYSLFVTDNNGCTATDNVVVTVRATPTAAAGPDKTIGRCAGDSTVIGDIPAAIGGTGPYSYSWSPATGLSSTTVANPVVKGILTNTTYTLSVTDANGCVGVDNVTVNVISTNLRANAGPDEAVCSNNNCVQLGGTPTAVAGTAPYTYAWSGGSVVSDTTASNPLACPTGTTTFTVTVTDSRGCTATDAEIVTVNPSPTANAGPDTSVCSGLAVGIGGSPSATGGTPGYTYSWNPTIGLSVPNIANPSASPTNITTYQLIVTDTKGCAALDEVTVTPRINPVVDAGADKTLVSCAGDTVFIGNLPVVVSGGTAPFTYDWTYGTGLSDSTIANPFVTGISTTTSYQIIVTDTFGCKGSDFVVVNVTPSTLQADAGNNGTICAASGSIVALGGSPTAVGGTSPYTFTWTSTDTTFTSNLSNPSVSPSGTTTYYVTVRDAKGCTSTDSVTVKFNTAPTVNAGTDTTICSGFCVTLGSTNTASGGSGPYQYAWTPAVGLNANNTANPLACPLVTTAYNVLVTDSNGCQSSGNVTITIRSNPVANAGADQTITNCSSDSVAIGGTPAATGGAGGYNYSWSPSTGLSSTTVANPVVKGINLSQLYTLVVTDANGCSAEDAVLVNVVPGSLVAEAGNGGAYCAGGNGSVTLGGTPTASGAAGVVTYTWSPSGSLNSATIANPVASPTVTTTYYLTITDSKGCAAFDSVKVTVYPTPTAYAGLDTTICAGVSVALGGNPVAGGPATATGGTPGYTYVWAPSAGLNNSTAASPIATPGATTNYTIRITDANGCTASDAVLVTVHPVPSAFAGPDKSLVACSGDSVQLGGSPAATGGTPTYHYDWFPNAGISDTAASNPYVSHLGSSVTYTLVVTDSFGCKGSDQVTVNVSNATLVAEAGNNVAFCQGASVSITLGGTPTAVGGTVPFNYVWSPSAGLSSTSVANPVATPLVTTTYRVVVTDGTGCIAEDSVRITINPRPVVDAGAADTICAGSTIQLGGSPTASGGTGTLRYNWTPSTYFTSLPSVANPLAQPLANITYVVTVTDSLGCNNNASVTIKVNQNPTANAGADQTVVACPTACVTLGSSPTANGGGGGYLYAWAPSAGLNNTGLANPSACNLGQSLTYNLTVTDVNGCTAIDQVLVTVVQSTLAADAGADKSICAGSNVCVTIGGTNAVSGGTAPYIIEWSPVAGICNSNSIPNPDVNPTDTTTYVLLVTDAYGCVAVDSMVLFANPAVTASVRPDTAICQGGAALLGGSPTGSGGTSPFTYTWAPGSGLSNTTGANPIATPGVTSTYCVTVTDAVGCSAATCQTVVVNPAISADAGPDRTITFCPGAFTQLGGSPTAVGGSNNYSYAWTPATHLNGSTVPNPIVTGLDTTTTFTVTVTDNATGCFATDLVTVIVNQTNLAADAGTNKIFCANSNGCVQIGGIPTAVGGQAPYIYQWAALNATVNDPLTANPCVSPLNTTQYFVTVTDQLGCNQVDSVTVTVSPFIVVNAGNDTSICTATQVVLGGNPVVVGGTGPFVYAWSAGAFPTNVAHPTASPSGSTSYTLVVTDSLGCSASDLINVALRPLPIANAGPDASITACALDSAVLGGSPTASGTVPPYTYSWFPITGLDNPVGSNPVVDSLGSNVVYTVTVTDTFGCKATDQVQVTVNPVILTVEAGANIGAICSNTNSCVTLGGNPTVTGSGTAPYTYDWFGGVSDPTVSNPVACPTATTTYAVIVTDANGCRGSDTVQVIVNTPDDASISGLNSSYCVNAGNIVMTGIPAGGTFSGPGVTGNVFQPGTVGAGFWCIHYDYTNPSTGCHDDTVICVTVTPLPVVTASGFAPAYCRLDSAVTLTGSPAGGVFTGSTGLSGADGSIFNPLTASLGNNTITYTYNDTASGCSNTYTFVINVKAAPSIDITASTDTSCQGQVVTFTPNYSFDVFNINWTLQGGGIIGSGLNPITYVPVNADYCVIANAVNTPNGCFAQDTVCGHVNQSPVANDDQGETCEETPTTIAVTINDTDPEGDASVVTVLTAAHGATTVNNNVVTYTPTLNYFGSDTITYQLCNVACANACDTATVVVSICPVNDPPVVPDVRDTIYVNTTDTVCLAISDVDDTLFNVSTFPCGPINGTVSVVNGCIVYVPTTNYVGTQVICVSVCDNNGGCDTATVTVVVVPVNRAPIGLKISAATCSTNPIGVNVAAATTDPDGDAMNYSYSAVTGPGASTWTVTGNGSAVFSATTPGVYSLTYYVCDQALIYPGSLCDTNIITIRVISCDSTNNPPVATDDAAVTTVNTGIVVNELANDYDADGDPLTVTLLCGPSLGGATAVLNADNTVSYSSPVTGIDTICYAICDPSGACDSAIIVVYVDSTVNTNHPPIAVDDFGTTTYVTPITVSVLANDHDPDGDVITVTAIPCSPTSGTATINPNGTITYSPDSSANAYNPDTFCYVICDNKIPALCDTATVIINIVNSVVAVNECVETGFQHPIGINVLANDYDPEHVDSFWVASVFNLPNTLGSVTLGGRAGIVYTPRPDTCGYIDTFAYIIQDETGAIDTGYVCVSITCCLAPVGVNDVTQVLTGDSVTVVVTANDTISGDITVNQVLLAPLHGTATFINDSTVRYVPAAGYCGYDTFAYNGENTCGFDTAFVVVQVICNTKPDAVNDIQTICLRDTLTFSPLANDVDADGDSLHISGFGPLNNPFGLTVSNITDSTITIISNGATGDVNLQYYICDNGLPVKCDTATIAIHIDACNPPVVKDIYDTLSSCVSNDSLFFADYVTLGGNYTWSVNSMCQPDNGTLVYTNTAFLYTPNTGFFGNDTFCVVICTNIGICDTAQIVMTTVDCLIDAIDEACDVDTTIINTPITVDVLANDILPYAADTTVTIAKTPANGTAVVNANNTVTYTPNAGFKGTEQFTYLVCGVTGDFVYCDSATVCITVIDTTVNCYIPNGFSPNGDGTNDTYVIPCGENNPKATVRIFDRWGVEVWFSNGPYANDFAGKNMQGTVLPDGTYYIIYEYNDGTNRREAKFVVIQR
jgi:gliding motility-associated-like protein